MAEFFLCECGKTKHVLATARATPRKICFRFWWLFLLRDTEHCTRPTCATLMSYFGSCFAALSVLLQVWIGLVHGMKSCMIGTVESMNLRPFMASSYGHNDVSSNIGPSPGMPLPRAAGRARGLTCWSTSNGFHPSFPFPGHWLPSLQLLSLPRASATPIAPVPRSLRVLHHCGQGDPSLRMSPPESN